MSLHSPSKNERIERHLMRQRGAGARTINADFGFSFAGFSAPNSQEATPTAALSRPSPKRRKTIAEDKGVEQEVATTSALDRRGRTKAARAKRRFVVDADDEPTKSKSVDGEDSFVKRVGPGRRNGRGQQESRESKEEQVAYETSETVPKAESTRPRNASKRGKKAREDQDVDAVAANTEGEQSELTKQVPRRRRRAPASKTTNANVRDGDIVQKDEEFPDVAPAQATKSKARAKKAVANDTRKFAVPAETSDRGEASKAEPEGAPKKSRRKRKATKEDGEDEQRKAQNESPSSDENEQPAKAELIPRRNQAKAGSKSKAAKNQTLAVTPPQLERRPLQDADANRSPSPRKSPDKEQQGPKPQTSPKGTSSKRKRSEVAETSAPGQDCPRKSRKLKVQRDEDKAPGEAKSSTIARKEHPEKPDVEVVSAAAAAKDEESQQQNVKEPTRSDRRKKSAKASESSKLQAVQSTSTENEACDEEDVDWLFAAPDARPRPAKTKSITGEAFAPKQKAKLADIDLDDLIANVALFAQTSGPQSSKPGAGGGGLGGTARKGRKR